MKVMCVYTPCGPSYVRLGWGRALSAMGHEFIFWKPEVKSAFDAFNEQEPDLFIGTTYDLTPAICKCIKARPNMRVILYASAWGPLTDKIDQKKYPIVVANKQETEQLQRLKDETGQPEFVFIHVTDKYLEGTMGHWERICIKPVGILNAADLFDYSTGTVDPALVCDIGFVGGYWDYKARNLNRYILPLCDPKAGLRVKIFGNQPWPVHQYLGLIHDKRVATLFASATICPSVSEPHSTDLGWDIIERPFKVLSAGGFCISDHVDEMSEAFADDELIRAKTPEEFSKLIQHYLRKPNERLQLICNGRRRVLKEHTYFHRVAKMLTNLGMADEAERALRVQAKLFGDPGDSNGAADATPKLPASQPAA